MLMHARSRAQLRATLAPPVYLSLAAEDRCHLNGLALEDGRPRYVTAMSETDTPDGWRRYKATGGCLIDVPSGATLARGFAMPHSPRVHQGRIWLLDSGRGRLMTVDPKTGSSDVVCELPGYTRGLAMAGPVAFVGLSRIRETSTFDGVPVADRRDELKCGVAVVEVASGRQVALLEFHSGVEEIFDVQLLSGVRNPVISGPYRGARATRSSGWCRSPDKRPEAARSPAHERAVFGLVYYHGLTQAQVAELFQVDVTTARSWWETAVVTLHQELTDGGEADSRS